jgi:glycosyltransferase involved in cell wall biosynthesis
MRISVVTPSYNQAQFIRATIDSVLEQNIPDLEYWVVDGGSTDGTVDILRSYGNRIHWISERDRGQSDAINKGLKRLTGDVVCWLNSDDVFLPGCLQRVSEAFAADPSLDLVYGDCRLIDEHGADLGRFPATEDFDLWRLINIWDYILQPSAFFRRSAVEALGWLREDLHYTMDWDLWIRLALRGGVRRLEGDLACSREYGTTKTASGGWRRFREIARLMRSHGAPWLAPGILLYGSDTVRKNWVGNRVMAPLTNHFANRVAAWAHRRLASRHPDGWAGPRCDLWLPCHHRQMVDLDIVVHPWYPDLGLAIHGAGPVQQHRLLPGRHRLQFKPPSDGGPLRLLLQADRHIIPAQSGSSTDTRQLSYQILFP